VFEVRQHVRHYRLERTACLITLRADQGDERPTGDQGVGQTEGVRHTMIVEERSV
jgi:hypothetical protein